jgi:electron transfer flavoprotein alpha subunit|tara:strand:- start:2141 stop:3082 length:942 start_codon:yes stop_codon:yes gene_type:complete
MSILIIGEHDNEFLTDSTLRTITAALSLKLPIDILLTGSGAEAVAQSNARYQGVSRVLLALNPSLNQGLTEPLADVAISLAKNYRYVMAPSSTTGKNLLPRVAAQLNVMQLSDVIEIVSHDTLRRPIYAGNAIQTVRSRDEQLVMTIRTSGFEPAERTDQDVEVESISWSERSYRSRFVSEEIVDSDRPELSSARIVVSGGRALGSKEKFDQFILPLADKLNAAIGASRVAVDSGYGPNDWQVGQTGKVVAPDLYIACGISGAIQHIAGMKDSEIIVAINKDEDAPIFQIADYGIVGDLFEVIPLLITELDKG